MKKEEDAAKKKKPKTSPAQLRVQKGKLQSYPFSPYQTFFKSKVNQLLTRPSSSFAFFVSDLTELELPKTMKTDFPDPADVLNFTLTIEPDEGKPLLPP